MREIAKDLNVSERTIWRVVHANLGLKSYKCSVDISYQQVAPRRNDSSCRRKKILEEMHSAGDMILIWSDEKIFTV